VVCDSSILPEDRPLPGTQRSLTDQQTVAWVLSAFRHASRLPTEKTAGRHPRRPTLPPGAPLGLVRNPNLRLPPARGGPHRPKFTTGRVGVTGGKIRSGLCRRLLTDSTLRDPNIEPKASEASVRAAGQSAHLRSQTLVTNTTPANPSKPAKSSREHRPEDHAAAMTAARPALAASPSAPVTLLHPHQLAPLVETGPAGRQLSVAALPTRNNGETSVMKPRNRAPCSLSAR